MNINELRQNGRLQNFTFPGLYPIIYWWKEADGNTYPLCGDCSERLLAGEYGDPEDFDFIQAECGADYDDDLKCDNCYRQLAAYYEED